MTTFSPPYNAITEVVEAIKSTGFALINCQDFFTFTKTSLNQWESLKVGWQSLEPDAYLKDGGKYRQRKHASVTIGNQAMTIAPYRPHFQPISYNALHGGMHREFAPCDDAFLNSAPMQQFLLRLAQLFTEIDNTSVPTISPATHPWFIEVHQFRIDTSGGIGRPTPEGAHRDGVNYVAVLLVDRHQVKGGESRVFDSDSPNGQRFTLEQGWSLLLLDDTRVLHETTPIQPLDREHPENTWRDTLVITFRKDSFLEEVVLTTPSTTN